METTACKFLMLPPHRLHSLFTFSSFYSETGEKALMSAFWKVLFDYEGVEDTELTVNQDQGTRAARLWLYVVD